MGQHTRYKEFGANRDQLIMDSLHARTFTNKDKAAQWLKDFLSPRDSEAHLKAVAQFNESMAVVNDAILGKENGILTRHKTVTSSVGLVTPMMVQQYIVTHDELTLDNEWMAVYRMDDLTGGFMGSITTIKQSFRFAQVNDKTDPAPMGPFAKSEWSIITPEFFKGGMKIANDILLKDPLTSLNLIFVVARYAMLEMKTANAYLGLNAGFTAANSAGYTTAFTTSAQKSITLGKVALLTRNKAKGFKLTANSQIRIFASLELQGDVETIFGAFAPNNNEIAKNYRAIGNFTRHYSLNVESDLGLGGGDCVALVLGQYDNCIGQFSNPKFAQDQDILTDTTRVVAQEDYIFLTEETQIQIVHIS